jgi:hypothetical protein
VTGGEWRARQFSDRNADRQRFAYRPHHASSVTGTQETRANDRSFIASVRGSMFAVRVCARQAIGTLRTVLFRLRCSRNVTTTGVHAVNRRKQMRGARTGQRRAFATPPRESGLVPPPESALSHLRRTSKRARGEDSGFAGQSMSDVPTADDAPSFLPSSGPSRRVRRNPLREGTVRGSPQTALSALFHRQRLRCPPFSRPRRPPSHHAVPAAF